MRILVTGATGQLARELRNRWDNKFDVIALDREQLDVRRRNSVIQIVKRASPAVIVNCAAYTAVDKAERDSENAFAVNESGARNVAEAAHEVAARVVHISTDFVFDGQSKKPYSESDQPNPLNVYGKSKLAGEDAVLQVDTSRTVIVRTSWLYGNVGKNFVTSMLNLMSTRTKISVVDDQIGGPTSVYSLSRFVDKILEAGSAEGVIHWSDDGAVSWHDFSVAIYGEARALGLVRPDVDICRVSSQEYGAAAPRPSYSVLDCRKAVALTGLTQVDWRDSLRKVLKGIAEQ